MIMIRNQLAVYQLEMYGNMSDLFDLMLKNWPMAGCYFRHSNVQQMFVLNHIWEYFNVI